ncbi:MAG: type I polyketide synthase [Streptosporangiaceae bacterium]
MTRIAVVGMACRYPDATSPRELWENALAGRRAFRRLPDERMRLADYWDADPAAPDRFYARTAAVIEGYEFDRIAHKVAGSTFRSTDLTHWLALDMAGRALADAGFPQGEGLPRQRTGVIVGNTLTGEFTRANLMRLRWPYVHRTFAAALEREGWDQDRIDGFLAGVESAYKSPFPAVDEDTLAGGLSNTIAGRICNHFDLNGGGYTVDGACSSSLLSVATACKALVAGELDVAVAGGVDLSIDPFETIGFAKTGALARHEMRVYDRGSNGFWPGEGCGMLVLMRESDAARDGRRSHAAVAGWGMSSDGRGGITRPEVSGYRLALGRAYESAGFGIDTVGLFEGHGTGTEVGDETELTALAQERAAADPAAPPAAISTIKGMIGHTKAAAGVAGLIKAVLAVREQMLPPTVGCLDPHPAFAREPQALRPLRKAEPWPEDVPLRAGVTAMGFGGINTHVVVEGIGPRRPPTGRTRSLAASVQDVELLLVDGGSLAEVRRQVAELADWVPALSYAELADLAAAAQLRLRDLPYRAAVIVTSPEDAERQLRRVLADLDTGETSVLTADGRAFLGHAGRPGRIGYLFPGQGSGRGVSGGALRRRFAGVEQVYAEAALPTTGDLVATEIAQPRIVTGSLAGLRILTDLGVEATVAVGHSLGEISALHWAGALDAPALTRVAGIRGRAMSEHGAAGTMAGVGAGPDLVRPLLDGMPVVIAGYNGPAQTIVSGPPAAIATVGERAAVAGLAWNPLRVSHAFHSPLVAPAADALAAGLAAETPGRVRRPVISTVTGEVLASNTDVPALLHRQLTEPVLFAQALELAAKDLDLLVEVGPGRVLAGLAPAVTDVPALALDTDDESLTGLLRVIGAAFVLGAPIRHEELFAGRLTRPLRIGAEFSFFASPCESAPATATTAPAARTPVSGTPVSSTPVSVAPVSVTPAAGGETALDLLRGLVAERAELPAELVGDDSRLLDDLHLSSITVGQIMNMAALGLGLTVAQPPANLATATLRELAETLDLLAETAVDGPAPVFEGAAAWARPYSVELLEEPGPAPAALGANGPWQLHADTADPLAEPLRQALAHAGVGKGTLVSLPARCEPRHLDSALEAARTTPEGRFVLVQQGPGAAGLARTLHLEAPHLHVTIVQLPPCSDATVGGTPPRIVALDRVGPLPEVGAVSWRASTVEVVDRVVREVAGTAGFAEAHYDVAGLRRVPTLRAMPVRASRERAALGRTDVLLVTGGGKGITAECALAVARDSGAALGVLGRSDPREDPELAANLRRMTEQGVTVRYARADVSDLEQVRAAVDAVEAGLGPVTALLHGAGYNEPKALGNLGPADLRRAFAPKVEGLRTVLAAVDPGNLRMLVTFGSIIGRAGLRGEAHYATANEWLAALTTDHADRYPACRTLCLEWSVWSGVGMGERLSVVESLAQEGITAISPDQGVEILRRLLADPDAPAVVVISGRTGAIDTVRHERPELPLLRFVGRPLVRYHGVELVTEVELNAGTDPYLDDHRLDGDLLFPAVFGLEAMVQTAVAATGRTALPVIEHAEFLRPIVVAPHGSTTLRIAATVTADDTVRVAIRSADTGFAAEHFRACLRFPADHEVLPGAVAPETGEVAAALPPVPLDPATDMYGSLLFQGARFQRLRRYHRAAARDVEAEVAASDEEWFAGFLPADLLLGDPGLRDALMHGLQVCVPDATLLPTRIDRLSPGGARLTAGQNLRLRATERSRDGDLYVYDLLVCTAGGEVVERWEGLHLQAVRRGRDRGPWAPALLGPYLERTVEDLTGVGVAVVVEPYEGDVRGAARRAKTALAVGRAAGRPVTLRYRPDGRPEAAGGLTISAAHGPGLTLATVLDGAANTGATLGCDVEAVAQQPWAGLLGANQTLAGLLATETGEEPDVAGTRVWTALECLRKAGLAWDSPLTFAPPPRPGWVVLTSGSVRIATFATLVGSSSGPVVFAILTEERS